MKRRRRVVIHLDEDKFRALQRYADSIGHFKPESLPGVVAGMVLHELNNKGLVQWTLDEGWLAVEGPLPRCHFSVRGALGPHAEAAEVEEAERVFWRELNRGQK